MKFTETKTAAGKLPLLNDHYVTIPYDCSALSSLAKNGIIPAGTIIPSNDASAKGVLFEDVIIADNPNGAILIHAFIDSSKLPAAAETEAKTALNQIYFS